MLKFDKASEDVAMNGLVSLEGKKIMELDRVWVGFVADPAANKVEYVCDRGMFLQATCQMVCLLAVSFTYSLRPLGRLEAVGVLYRIE